MIMSSKGEGRKTPQQHDDNHDAAPPTGIAAPEQNKEQINLYARAGPYGTYIFLLLICTLI